MLNCRDTSRASILVLPSYPYSYHRHLQTFHRFQLHSTSSTSHPESRSNSTNVHLRLSPIHIPYLSNTVNTRAASDRVATSIMESGSSRDPDGLNSNAGAAQNKSAAKGSSSTTKRQPKDAAKPKPIPSASGTRFQCPRCPKNFSRIENLTRHQANREFNIAREG